MRRVTKIVCHEKIIVVLRPGLASPLGAIDHRSLDAERPLSRALDVLKQQEGRQELALGRTASKDGVTKSQQENA